MRRMLVSAVTTAVMLFSACGSSSPAATGSTRPPAGVTTPAPTATAAPASPASTSPASSSSASTSAASTSSTLPASPAPTKIISLSPSATEDLYAIGAGDQVLAVDDQSNYPPEVLNKPHDLSGYQPNVEAIASRQPDLVLIGDDSSGLSKQLDALGLKTWVGPAATSFNDVYTQIQQLGGLTGHVDAAASLVSTMQAGIDAAVKAAPKPATALTYYHELDNTYYSITENTFIGQVYSLFGMHSIANLQQVSSDYPQLSAEAIISANPDFIFLADGGFGESPQTVAARPGWSSLKAVAKGNVIVVDADISSRWGPRVVDYVKAISADLSKAAVAG